MIQDQGETMGSVAHFSDAMEQGSRASRGCPAPLHRQIKQYPMGDRLYRRTRMRQWFRGVVLSLSVWAGWGELAIAQSVVSPSSVIAPPLAERAIASPSLRKDRSPNKPAQSASISIPSVPAALDLPPGTVENSPLLQRWLEEIPDVRSQIRRDPAFRTRLRAGYAYFPREESGGFSIGIEDLFVGRTGLTLSGDYQQGRGDRQSFGTDLRYYIFPLGSVVNLAPVVGYRHLETTAYTTTGINLGARVQLSLSRRGAADLSLTQSWVAPGSDEEVGITTLSLGYALTRNLRLSTDLQKQNAPQRRDSRVGIVLEWML